MTARSPLAFVVNPAAGAAARGGKRVRGLAEMARQCCAAAGVACEVTFTEGPGHGRELAAALADRGFSPVVACGGDGTVNEVASALLRRDAVLGIVPAGSGNGLARELGISRRPGPAIRTAVDGDDRTIDVGEMAGRPFVNLAGVGLAVSVADLFNRLAGRGLAGYVRAAARELVRYRSRRYTLVTEGGTIERTALFVEVANGRQYGNGAIIAPRARLDDGLLELVSVDPIGPARVLWGLRRLFDGTIDRQPYVRCSPVGGVTISADGPLQFHVDGEVAQGGRSLSAAIHPKALRVRVPPRAGG